MNPSWTDMILPYLVAIILLVAPGLAVIIAGWGWRRIELILLAPAVSVALVAVSAVLAPVVGTTWSVLPVIVLSALAALAAFGLRRWAGPATDPKARWRPWGIGLVALACATLLISAQLVWAFGAPENIAQRFDNIVHLNGVRYALETANASGFHIGDTSNIGFYPNGWHAFTSLVIQLTGVDLASGVNIANMAIAAVLWPASVMAFTAALVGVRSAALVGAAALSTGFGAFPALFFNWGVLYPNVVGYSMTPALLAAGVIMLRSSSVTMWVRSVALVVVLACGAFLGHPTSILAVIGMGGAYTIVILAGRAISRRSLRMALTVLGVAAGIAIVAIAVWSIARTSPEHSAWQPWQTAPQAVGEAFMVLVRGYPPTLLSLLLIVAGLVVVIRRPRLLPAAVPFMVAILFFVVSSGLRADHPLRQIITNPWYNDPNRLAALLPLAAIPVAVLGLVTIVDVASGIMRRWKGGRQWAKAVVWACGAALLATVAVGPNVVTALRQVKEAYTATADSLLLSVDERALLERLPTTTPDDAVIAGSPRTGTSLAYALAGREVLEKHVFGTKSPDEGYLNAHLRDIDVDPAVCAAVRDSGATYVLDFGRRDIMDDEVSASSYDGIQNLPTSTHLVLVDSEGSAAKLFRIEGC